MNSVTTRDISVVRVALRALRSPAGRRAVFGFAGTVLKDFFALQFSVRLGLRKIPIVDVDHPLDDEVPFAPDKIGPYLDFIHFWIRPLGYIGRRFGGRAQDRYTAEYLALIHRCYREAAVVYRDRMSTTRRPRHLKGRFLLIHLFDPHYLCVPSLHVMIVVLTHSFYRRAFAELNLPLDEAAALDAELFQDTTAITETVLYIKQHSVNCIPAALYAMSRISPNEVTAAEVHSFIDGLFVDAPELAAGAGERIREFIHERFDELVADGAGDDDWVPAVQRFLAQYPLQAG